MIPNEIPIAAVLGPEVGPRALSLPETELSEEALGKPEFDVVEGLLPPLLPLPPVVVVTTPEGNAEEVHATDEEGDGEAVFVPLTSVCVPGATTPV